MSILRVLLDSKAVAAASIQNLNLNIFLSVSSLLSAELFTVRLAVNTLIGLDISSNNIQFLSDSLPSIHLLSQLNYHADDQDFKGIR